jgi:hypothetical protein
MRVGQPRRRLGLPGKSLADVLLKRQFGREYLDRHSPLQPLVPGAVDHAHAAAPDLSFDGIGVAQRLSQPGWKRSIAWRCHVMGRPSGTKACLWSMGDNLYL